MNKSCNILAFKSEILLLYLGVSQNKLDNNCQNTVVKDLAILSLVLLEITEVS